jgi:hypothetical protein
MGPDNAPSGNDTISGQPNGHELPTPGTLTDKQKNQFMVHLEEYRACRTEILEQLKFQGQALTIGSAIAGALTTVAVTLHTNRPTTPQSAHTLLIIPVVAFLFGMWMVQKDSIIIRLASYITSVLKPKVARLCETGDGDTDDWYGLLSWDEYRASYRFPVWTTVFQWLAAAHAHIFFLLAGGFALAGAHYVFPVGMTDAQKFTFRAFFAWDISLLIVFAVAAGLVSYEFSKFADAERNVHLSYKDRHVDVQSRAKEENYEAQ